jgi:hypothetical protein
VYAAALEEKPALARDFLDFYWIHEYRLLYDLKKLDPAYAAAIFDQRRAEEAERKFLEVAPRFKISPDRPHRGTWHKSSLPGLIHGLQRDEYKALWDLYLHGYRTGSDVAHGSVIDLMGRLEVKADGDIEQSAEPSERFVAQALITAHSSLLLMLVVCNHALGLSIEEMLQGLYEKHRALWPGDSAV